jgi:hypothetical protein
MSEGPTRDGAGPPSHVAVRLPVREAETVVRSRALAAGSPLQPQDGGVMAHLTLLSPFLPEASVDDGVVAELQRYFAEEGSFGFELTGVSTLPGGATYLVPEPAAVFRELTEGLVRLFPTLSPYDGRFADLVPHLSVPLHDGEDAASLAAELEHRLPIECFARAATLVRVAEHDTRTLATFPFGSDAA